MLGWVFDLRSSSRRFIADCQREINNFKRFQHKSETAQRGFEHMKTFARIEGLNEAERG
jgi:hypothetical protein